MVNGVAKVRRTSTPSILIEGSTISNFTFGMVKNNNSIGFSKTVSGSNLILSQNEINQIIQLSPDYFVVNSNNLSIDTETNQPIEFRYTYLYNSNKINNRIIFSAISTIYNEIVRLGENNPINRIQNLFGFDLTNYINPNGNDEFTFSNTINNAYETNRKLSSVVLIAKTALETTESNVFSSIAKTIIEDNTIRLNPTEFFNQKTNTILVESKKQVLNLNNNQQLTQEQTNEIDIISNNTTSIINKDIEEFSKGNTFSSIVFTKKILENIGSVTENKTTTISNIANQIAQESATVVSTTTTPAPTTTTTTPEPTTTTTTTLPPATFSYVYKILDLTYIDSINNDIYDLEYDLL